MASCGALDAAVQHWDSYWRNIAHHVVPHVGHIPLRRLRTADLESLYPHLVDHGRVDRRGGLAPKTVHEVHVALRNALGDAVRRHLVAGNVALNA
jgi:hypothetical protein